MMNEPIIRISLTLLVSLLFVIPPVVRIVRKAGYSGWWALVALVAPLFVVGLWVFAFADWPSLSRDSH